MVALVRRSGQLRLHPDFVHTSREGEDVPDEELSG
jgi:hypothetical protein